MIDYFYYATAVMLLEVSMGSFDCDSKDYYLFFNLLRISTGISFIIAAPLSLIMILFNKFLVFSLI